VIEEQFGLSSFDDVPGLVDYANIPSVIAAVISSTSGAAMATLHECETIYSVEDVYLMLEVRAVDSHNRNAVDEWRNRRR
jgi:hypothetical protein